MADNRSFEEKKYELVQKELSDLRDKLDILQKTDLYSDYRIEVTKTKSRIEYLENEAKLLLKKVEKQQEQAKVGSTELSTLMKTKLDNLDEGSREKLALFLDEINTQVLRGSTKKSSATLGHAIEFIRDGKFTVENAKFGHNSLTILFGEAMKESNKQGFLVKSGLKAQKWQPNFLKQIKE